MSLTKREIIATSADGLTMCTSEVDGKPHRLTIVEPILPESPGVVLLTDDHIRAIVEYAAAMKLGYNRRKPGAKKAKTPKADAKVAVGAQGMQA